MKNYFFILLTFVLLLLNSCSPTSKCDLVDCQNGGICESGTCICETGFYGDFCDQTWISKFIGTYIGESKCVEQKFNSSFMSQSSLSGIITNFENTGLGLDVMLVDNLRFEFDNIILGSNRYSGYGELKPDLSLQIVYTAERDFDTLNYSKEYCSIALDKF